MPSSFALLPIVRVQITDAWTGKSLETCALQDTGSTLILINKSLKESMKFDTKGCKIEWFGIKTSVSITERVTVKSLKPENVICLVHPDLSVGSTN